MPSLTYYSRYKKEQPHLLQVNMSKPFLLVAHFAKSLHMRFMNVNSTMPLWIKECWMRKFVKLTTTIQSTIIPSSIILTKVMEEVLKEQMLIMEGVQTFPTLKVQILLKHHLKGKATTIHLPFFRTREKAIKLKTQESQAWRSCSPPSPQVNWGPTNDKTH